MTGDNHQVIIHVNVSHLPNLLILICLFFIWVLRPVKIISLILSQLLGGAKTGYPRERPPDHLGFSIMRPEVGSKLQR